MALKALIVLLTVVQGSLGRFMYEEEPLLYDTFPEGFAWGVSTSAYQIEGAVNEDGKGLNIWDTFIARNNLTDASVTCDSYHKWQDDIELMTALGVSHYRFSISWARILPEGVGTVNPLGVQWYSNFVDGLLEAGIEPMVTLYHWDLPQALEDLGGWLSDASSDWFLEYADAVFGALGDRAAATNSKSNEGEFPYIVAHNVLRSHGKAYRLYEEKYAASQNGQVGITLDVNYGYPDYPGAEDAAERSIEFKLGWFADPILLRDYPASMRLRIDRKSEEQGFSQSRLPYFTEEEKDMISGTADFLGINYYTGAVVGPSDNDINWVSYFADSDTYSYMDDSWFKTGSGWLTLAPFSLRQMMVYVKNRYGDIPVYITENGVSDRAGNLDDMHRVFYYKHYINNILKAIKIDGCNVVGYMAWSLMDNFEWNLGYTEKFGLHYIDFEDPERTRLQKNSAKWYAELIRNNGFVDKEECVLEKDDQP
ncbi:unnamed protein product [Cyprideis torosa]|uniref:beta-glucosidase n=1 Tax=Cyprideis torosa TaxID=163714 RepID=A0A7R8W9V9_9CRUS|nr:unnamed protein product [Cyprideis torosa]CAG0888912.1 unnamed protein product [Cyprideis torosa]